MAQGPTHKPLYPSLHGRRLGLGPSGEVVINNRVAVPNPNNPGQVVRLWDDFLGDVIADQWAGYGGTDAQALAPAITAGIGGLLRLTGGNANTDTATDASQLEGALNWQASNGDLFFETRLSMSAITNIAVFAGFTDAVGAIEFPIISAGSADTLTTTASDAVGFMFDTRMSTDNWWCVGVAGDTDATHINTGSAPVATTFERLRIEVDSAGGAFFYIDGVKVGEMDDAVTAATDLAPCIIVQPLTTTAHTVDLDYVSIEMLR